MKEIEYNGNLSDDIKNLSKKYNLKKEIVISLLSTAIATLSAYSILSLCGFMPSITNISAWIAGNVAIQTLRIKNDREDYLKSKNIAERNIKRLSKSLEVENIKTDRQTFQKSVLIKEENDNVLDNRPISNEEKLIKYFYLLDKEDQIRVLKQINSKAKNSSKRGKVFLLEKEDIKRKRFI